MNNTELQQIHEAIEHCHEARREAQRLLLPFLAPRLRHTIDAVIEPDERAALFQRAMAKIIDEFGYFIPPADWYQRLLHHIGHEVQRHLGPITPKPPSPRTPDTSEAGPRPRDLEDIGFTQATAQRAMDSLDLTRLGKLSSREATTLLLATAGVKQHDIAKIRSRVPSIISRELARAQEAYQDLTDGAP